MMQEIACTSDSSEDYNANNATTGNTANSTPVKFEKSTISATTPAVTPPSSENEYSLNEMSRLQALEQEQEQLNSSLMALTTHFAQVQFRLKQIVAAPNDEKENLLRELEEFAFRGCPDLNKSTSLLTQSEVMHEHIIEDQRLKQQDLIEQLKMQLQDLERYAYLSGSIDLPSDVLMEKQRVIIDELKEKINLPVENLKKLSNDELKKAVDNAISQVVNPAKVKEQLVTQLKTQVDDLERFIDFLQGDASSPGPYGKARLTEKGESAFPVLNQSSKKDKTKKDTASTSKSNDANNNNRAVPNNNNATTVDLLKRVLSVMQMFALSQAGCGTKNLDFEKNVLKKSTANHWGDLRAGLEMAIQKVLKIYSEIMTRHKLFHSKLTPSHLTESDDEITECPTELLRAIRKDLAVSLRDLMQHGLIEVNHSSSALVPFGCFAVRSKESHTPLHVWDLLVKYYEMKHGKEFTESAANKLSQSFALNVVSGKQTMSVKQSLLNAIETIFKVHKNDTSNKDSCFKAFVCLALNEKRLPLYLKQLLKTTVLIENYYQSWSYIKSTGFDGALKSLDQLKVLTIVLPVEKSVRRNPVDKNLI